jgi:hypothetical protein
MKHYRLCLIALMMLSFACSGYGQTFNLTDYQGRDNFYKYLQLSANFHSKDKLKCKNLNSRFVLWQYADTADFDLHKVHVFTHDGLTDSIRLDTVLTTSDRNYIKSQFDYYRDKGQKWENCGQWRILKLKANNQTVIPYWEFSIPLYSMDYNKCLVKMNYFKQESDYIISTVLFYKDKKGFWKEKAVIKLQSPGGK